MDYRSSELVDVIRRVRNRWRLKLALRGAVVVAAGTVLALLLSASGLESFRFSAPAIVTFRIVTVAVFVGLLFWGWVWNVWGMLLAVPMLVVIKTVCDHVEDFKSVGELLGE